MPPTVASEFYLLDTGILLHYARQDALMRHIEAEYSLLSSNNILVSVVTAAFP